MKKFETYSLLLGFFCVLIAARYSVGFPYADEHFQIVEFASMKFGITETLPWEYEARIRSWFQPAFALGLMYIAKWLGYAPAASGFILRLGFGLICFVSLCCFGWAFKTQWKRPSLVEKYILPCTLLFCFTPYLAVRTSSESFATAWSLAALSVFWIWPARLLLVGLLWGFAFLARFQMAFMFVGFFAWILWQRRVKDAFASSAGFVVALMIGLLIDRWGYGVWTVSFLNYFDANIIQGVAARFGVDPWWSYVPFTFKELPFPMDWLTIGAWVLFWILNPRHILTFVTLTFFLGHSAVGHKEARFLYPLFFLGPAMLLMVAGQIRFRRVPKKIVNLVVAIVCLLNLAALFKLISKPIQPALAALERIENDAGDSGIHCSEWQDKPPVPGTASLPIIYYKPKVDMVQMGRCSRPYYIYGTNLMQEKIANCKKLYSDPVVLYFVPREKIPAGSTHHLNEAWTCS